MVGCAHVCVAEELWDGGRHSKPRPAVCLSLCVGVSAVRCTLSVDVSQAPCFAINNLINHIAAATSAAGPCQRVNQTPCQHDLLLVQPWHR